MDMAEKCNIGETYIGHHYLNRTWAEPSWIDEILKKVLSNQVLNLK